MPAPRWLAKFNLHVTNRLLGPLARRLPGMGVVIHSGRKTRRQYRTPVLVFRRDGHFVIALTYGRQSEWVRNVLAEGGCQLETRSQISHLAHPRLFHDERRQLMPPIIRLGLRVMDVSDFLELETADAH